MIPLAPSTQLETTCSDCRARWFIEARVTACRGRDLGNRDSLIAIKNCAENDAIVPVLIVMGMLQPDLRRTVPSILGSCLVYELTAGAQALAIDPSEWVQA